AIANGSMSPTSVDLVLTYSAISSKATVPVPGNGQVVMFLDQIPRLGGVGELRISANSTAELSVSTMRGLYNERGDFLISYVFPFEEQSSPVTELFFPYIVDAAGYSTRLLLLNNSNNQTTSGLLQFFSQTGQLLGIPFR